MRETVRWHAHWVIERYNEKGELYNVSEFFGNMALNEGLNDIWNKVAGVAGTAFSNANAYIGVGDSAAVASASQTGLQAASNKAYAAMDVGYPTYGSSQQITFRATFGSAVANFDWEEFTVANGNSDSAVNLCRRVQAESTKSAGMTWAVTLTLTIS